MAYGDVGGPVTELVLTCVTPDSGTVSIATDDALKLTGAYTVDNATDAEDVIFGQALTDVSTNATSFPVKVRGVLVFKYDGADPVVDGETGILASATDGKVKAPASGSGVGVNVKVDAANAEVHVLL